MKSKLIATALFAATTATVVLFPHVRDTVAASKPPPSVPITTPDPAVAGQQRKVEVVFVLDTTGSMGGLIAAAKEKIWSIASTMAAANEAPEVRMGLVAYRDRGDAYVTKVVDLSSDLDSMYATLMDLRALGGGDGPESVNQALHEAVHRISWSQDASTYRVVFLVGDAPPHMDYPDDVPFPRTLEDAAARGIVVNAIQCGNVRSTTSTWRHIAQLGAGRYFQVEQGGSAVAIATPFDERMAALSRELDETRLYYGTRAEKSEKRARVDAARKLHEKSSAASQARRATYNLTDSGSRSHLGDKELVDDVSAGRVSLDAIETEALPQSLQALAPAEQKARVAEVARRRDAIRQELGALSGKRDAYLAEQVEARGGAKGSLDGSLFEALREQAGRAGLSYEADALRY